MPKPLDKTLAETLGRVSGPNDLFGVEIELEGKNIRTNAEAICSMWNQQEDGSLRKLHPGDDAVEYVFAYPMDYKNSLMALGRLYDHLNSPDVTVYDSYRTSIHVHINCLQETVTTVCNYVVLSIIFDELFVSQNGKHRQGNNFCLRAVDAEGLIQGAIQSINFYKNFRGYKNNNRYSSVNLASLGKFGTLEFRSLECTTDLKRVIHWVTTLQMLKEAARRYKSPDEIIADFSRMGPRRFLVSCLKMQSEKYLLVRDFEQMLFNGMRLAQDFAYSFRWGMEEQYDKPNARLQSKKIAADLAAILAHQQNPEMFVPPPPQPWQGQAIWQPPAMDELDDILPEFEDEEEEEAL